MKPIKPIYDEDYDICYGAVDYERLGNRVLEIGADHGSTAWYFFTKGAKQVTSVEANPALYNEMLGYKEPDDWRWTPVLLNVISPEQLKSLILEHTPQLMHMDCEGCETHLLDVPAEVLGMVDCFQLEIHTPDLHDRFLRLFADMNYKLIRDYWYTECPCWVTVWERPC